LLFPNHIGYIGSIDKSDIVPNRWVLFDWVAQLHQLTGMLLLLLMVYMLYTVKAARNRHNFIIIFPFMIAIGNRQLNNRQKILLIADCLLSNCQLPIAYFRVPF